MAAEQATVSTLPVVPNPYRPDFRAVLLDLFPALVLGLFVTLSGLPLAWWSAALLAMAGLWILDQFVGQMYGDRWYVLFLLLNGVVVGLVYGVTDLATRTPQWLVFTVVMWLGSLLVFGLGTLLCRNSQFVAGHFVMLSTRLVPTTGGQYLLPETVDQLAQLPTVLRELESTRKELAGYQALGTAYDLRRRIAQVPPVPAETTR